MKKKICVAMSGGVDSSFVAAYLLQNGFEVVGITMKLFENQNVAEDSKTVADFLHIEHHILDLRDDFQKYVVKKFVDEYNSARTPNPCVNCNENIKFGRLFDFAMDLGADFFATGHYARIENNQLKKSTNIEKDQSYFLYRIPRDRLSKIMFPLWNFSKEEVRRRAVDMNLPVAMKKDSQEICFVPNDDYKSFLRSRVSFEAGKIVSTSGKILGEHSGFMNYTIGQRRGLGISHESPLYVVNLDSEKNSVVVGSNEELFSSELIATDLKFLVDVPKKFRADVKIRCSRRDSKATIEIENDLARVKFDEPQRAITPGQSAVFYDSDLVLGGGFIRRL